MAAGQAPSGLVVPAWPGIKTRTKPVASAAALELRLRTDCRPRSVRLAFCRIERAADLGQDPLAHR